MNLKGALIVAVTCLAGSAFASSAQLKGKVVFPGEFHKAATLTVMDAAGKKLVAALPPDGSFDLTGVAAGEAAVTIRSGRQILEIPRTYLDAGVNDVLLFFPADLALESRTVGALDAYQRGLDLLERGEYSPALSKFAEALVYDTAQAATWGAMALANIGLNRFDDAIFCSRMASRFDPEESSFINNLGGAYFRMRRYDDAAAAYERAAKLNPAGAGLYLSNAGAAYFAAGDRSRAISAYERAVQATGCPNDSFFLLGYLFAKNGQTSRAAESLQEYVARDPNGAYVTTAKRLLGQISS